jgi:hypothetical protein
MFVWLQAAGKQYPGAQRHLHFQFYRQPLEVLADSSGQVRPGGCGSFLRQPSYMTPCMAQSAQHLGASAARLMPDGICLHPEPSHLVSQFQCVLQAACDPSASKH